MGLDVADDVATLVREYAPLAPVPLVPELRLHRTTDVYGLWETTAEPDPPFWAVPWAGGQALARYLLDNPHAVEGRRVLDVCAGSGLVAIAAARAGAATATAVDIDPRAIAVIEMNARANEVVVEAVLEDLLDGDGNDAEVVLIGDAFYERVLGGRMTAFLDRVVRRSATVLVGDLGRAYLPRERLRSLAAYDVPVSADLEDRTTKRTTVFAFHSRTTVTT
jgi:predicted nicotinamide N-methyase